MKSLSVKLNESKPITVNGNGLNHFQLAIGCDPDVNDSMRMQVWGYVSDDDSYIQYTWSEEKIDINDRLIVECIESTVRDEPVKTEDLGPIVPTCSFCQKAKHDVTCMIEGKFKMAHICDECVEVCVKVVAEYKLKNDA